MPDTDRKPEARKKKKKHKGRELVECLLVAGALALTIRHFGFQIFKIPTRSMEPTLYGHEHHGDRVVAMMWYKRGGRLPLKLGEIRRWQVLVFDHYDGEGRRTNFIKRLVGLPGEVVEIRDGDVWVDGRIARKPRGVQEGLWLKLCDMTFEGDRRLPHYWTVKPASCGKVEGGELVLTCPEDRKVRMLWASDYGIDNRFIRLTVKYLECGRPGCGHRFKAVFDNARPVAFCPKCHAAIYGVRDDGSPGVLTAATKRNSGEGKGDFWTEESMDVGYGSKVPDLRLSMDFRDLGRRGELEIVLVGRSERFALKLPLGRTEPVAELSGPRKVSASRRVPLAAGAGHHLEVVNVDGEFRAELDGVEVGPCQYAPSDEAGTSDAEVWLSGGAKLAVENLRLYRDIYYYHVVSSNGMQAGSLTSPNASRERTGHIEVPRGRYFFLGDNSLASQDGRFFGTKAEKDIIARGVLVAWPPSRIHWVK